MPHGSVDGDHPSIRSRGACPRDERSGVVPGTHQIDCTSGTQPRTERIDAERTASVVTRSVAPIPQIEKGTGSRDADVVTRGGQRNRRQLDVDTGQHTVEIVDVGVVAGFHEQSGGA